MLTQTLTSKPEEEEEKLQPLFSSRYLLEPLQRYVLPEDTMSREGAYQVIHDELQFDGNPRLNLASFVTTWMEPECDKLIVEALNKNFVDMDEYPITTELQDRCVNMLARLFHVPLHEGEAAFGSCCVGSSEAIMLAGLAMKTKWQQRRKAAGKPCDKPNMVAGANVQVCWEKFARYFEVELRAVKLTEQCFVMDVRKAVEMVDENTILVCATLGSTYNGEFEDVKLLNELLLKKNQEKGYDIPIHVDGASGGFVAPFLYPDLEWDFRLPLVHSINASGHKYGLVYPGIGWVVWRSKQDLPQDLIFHINYLGSDQPTFTLNFSRGASQVVAQYYQFIRLGFKGYKSVLKSCQTEASYVREALLGTKRFRLLSVEQGVPLVAVTLLDKSGYDDYELADHLRRYGWIVPAYTMAPDAQSVTLLRIVVREDFSRAMADRLVQDMKKVMEQLDKVATKKGNGKVVMEDTYKVEEARKASSEEKKRKVDAADAFDRSMQSAKAFHVWKKHAVPKTNAPC